MSLNISREELHRKIYFFGLALLVFCLPLSRFLLSVAQFLLALNWLAEGNFRKKIALLRQRPEIILFASVFLLYVVGSLYSENTKLALEKIRNTLPLLLMPIVIGTSNPFSARSIKQLFLLFALGVLLTAIICVVVYILNGIPAGTDFRKISVFMPHIRFSLLIDMALSVMLYYLFQPRFDRVVPLEKYMLTGGFIFLTAFLLFLRSATGIAIFILLLLVFVLHTALHSKYKIAGYAIMTFTLVVISAIVYIVISTWTQNFGLRPLDASKLEILTVNGNVYVHNVTPQVLENGHYINLYVCEPEMETAWNGMSSIRYDGFDQRGQPIRGTIKRYLTSKGLRKDSAGIHSLSANDRLLIEKGIANCNFSDNPGIRQRLYETLWEAQVYARAGYVNMHTFGQRLVFIKTALSLIKENGLTGTGPGDVYALMRNSKTALQYELDPSWEGKPHNQYAFFLLSFGITGFVWILFCWLYPVFKARATHRLLFNSFGIIIIVSMFLLDTMESYDSIAFFASFYSLFVFGNREFKN
jgi:hypothetical protein